MQTISIITPVYFNAPTLEEHINQVSQLRSILQQDHNMNIEMIYVNDGSEDDSLEKLKKIKQQYSDWVKVISLSRNFGVMNALSASLDYITGDCFCLLTADLQDPPMSILKLVTAWKQGHKFAICVRSKRSDPLLTTLFSKIFYFLLNRFIIKNYPKGGFDTHLLDASLLPAYKRRAKNFNLQIYTIWLGIKPKIFYEERQERQHGKSRWTFKKKFKLMIDSFIGFSTAPLKITAIIGLTISLLSFLYGAFVLINALLGHVSVPGYPTIVCLMSFLFGIVILILTIIAEYIVRIYDEVTDKPAYIIEEVL